LRPPLVLRVYLIEVLKINIQIYEKKMGMLVLFSEQHKKNHFENEIAYFTSACDSGYGYGE